MVTVKVNAFALTSSGASVLSGGTMQLGRLRSSGWIAQWKEMIADPIQRIGRSRQLYNGASEQSYISTEAR